MKDLYPHEIAAIERRLKSLFSYLANQEHPRCHLYATQEPRKGECKDGTSKNAAGCHLRLYSPYCLNDWHVYVFAPTWADMLDHPEVKRHLKSGVVSRMHREEDERSKTWVCTPDPHVYKGVTANEAGDLHAKYLRSGYSRAGSSAYHFITVNEMRK